MYSLAQRSRTYLARRRSIASWRDCSRSQSGRRTLRNIIVPMPEYEITEEGTYWFDLLFSPGGEQDDRLLTRLPFTVVYQPQRATA